MSGPILSVSVTNYNYGRLIGRALDSILAQSFGDFELIIVDNASTDDSVAIIRQYMLRDPRIRLIEHKKNLGLAQSLAEAATAAKGRYYVHVDADDWVLDQSAFCRQIGMLESNPAVSVVYSPIVMCDDFGHMVVYRSFPSERIDSGAVAIEQAIMGQIINTGPMIRMSAFRSFGGYNTSFLYAIDVKLAIDLCGAGCVGYISQPLYAFYQHPDSLTHTSSLVAKQRELVRAVESAFSGPLRGKIPNAPRLQRRALAHMLALHGTQYIFNNHYRAGWAAYLSGLRMRPDVMLAQPRMLSLVGRTLLGKEGYQRLRAVLKRFNALPGAPPCEVPEAAYAMSGPK